ncbi:hypothetical protein CDD83_5059 [Cordyceps sp. RAO-2017]|nr:hypothetical protein CDD83_5059 [Cordyceps sp. RAO-2017]
MASPAVLAAAGSGSGEGAQHGLEQQRWWSCANARRASACAPKREGERRRGCAPSSILWYADGQPTFLVLLDARRLGAGHLPLHLLLVDDELAVRQALGADDLALAELALGPVRQLALEGADLGADLAPGA